MSAKSVGPGSFLEKFLLLPAFSDCGVEYVEHTKWAHMVNRDRSCREAFELISNMYKVEQERNVSFERDSYDATICRCNKIFKNVQKCETHTNMSMKQMVEILEPHVPKRLSFQKK